MPTASVVRPTDPQAAGFRRFANYLEAHSRGFVKRFVSFAGTVNDAAPPANGMFPFTRIYPVAMPATPRAGHGPLSRRGYECPMRVDFELAVAGNLVDDLMNLWGRWESLIFPDPNATAGRNALLDHLTPYGVRDIRLIQRALPHNAEAFTGEMISGMGAVLLVFELAV